MLEQPLLSILDCDQAKNNAIKHFSDQITLMKDLTNYGSNLVIRAFNSSSKELSPTVVCGILLKQIVAMLDAIYVLIQEGTAHASFLPARTAFEASIYLDWILFSDGDKKSRAYFVSNFRDERVWCNKAIKGTPEEAIFSTLTKSIGFDMHARRPTLAADAQKRLTVVNQTLSSGEFAIMDEEFNKIRGKSKNDPEWYQVCGAKSIRQVAKSVDRLPEYEFFYSKGSQITHTASYKDHIYIKDKEICFKPIRNLEGIDQLLNFTVGIAMRSFQNILKFYRPSELQSFATKYINDWRKPFLSFKSVKYNY